MALKFDPKLEPSGSRGSRTKQQKNDSGSSRSSKRGKSAAASSAGKRSKSTKGGKGAGSSSKRGKSSASAPAKGGKRKSIGAKAKQKAAKSTHAAQAELEKLEPVTSTPSRSTKFAKASARTTDVSTELAEIPLDEDAKPARSRRVGDVRARERAQRNRSRYIRYVLRILIVIVAVLVVIFGSIFIYRSDFLHVNNVKVKGVSHLTSNEITDLAAVPADSTLLRLDAAGISDRLQQNAWVQEAKVHRVFPDTLELEIVERAPGAVVRVSEKATWVVSTDGTWLSAATENDWKTQMRIIDVSKSLPQPISGSDCNDGGIKNALEILDGISDKLRKSIKSISAESSIKTSLNLKDGITVAFGDSSDIQLKEAVINKLLKKYKGKISYINVRVPSRPTFHAMEN